MLAAIPDPSDQLGTVRVTLDLIARDADVPGALRAHLLEVISQALRIVENQPLVGVVNAEAVNLAVDVHGDALTRELGAVRDFGNITPDLAQRLLNKLQHAPA